MATWPANLPVPLLQGYELEAGDTTARTDMESGPARVRRRFTAAPDGVSLSLLLTETEMNTFRDFWDGDWAQGAAWVFFPVRDGRTPGIVSKECRPNKGPFKAQLAGPNSWRVQIPVEVRDA